MTDEAELIKLRQVVADQQRQIDFMRMKVHAVVDSVRETIEQ